MICFRTSKYAITVSPNVAQRSAVHKASMANFVNWTLRWTNWVPSAFVLDLGWCGVELYRGFVVALPSSSARLIPTTSHTKWQTITKSVLFTHQQMQYLLNLERFKIHTNIAPTFFGLRLSSGNLYWAWSHYKKRNLTQSHSAQQTTHTPLSLILHSTQHTHATQFHSAQHTTHTPLSLTLRNTQHTRHSVSFCTAHNTHTPLSLILHSTQHTHATQSHSAQHTTHTPLQDTLPHHHITYKGIILPTVLI
jgi:hypothetical protein